MHINKRSVFSSRYKSSILNVFKELIIYTLPMIFFSCNTIDMHQLKKHPIACSEMPKPVFYSFKNAFEKKHVDGDKNFTGVVNMQFINLDSSIKARDLSIEGKSGVRPGINRFEIKNKVFEFTWNGNRENEPFIFYNGILYYNLTLNISNIESCECEYVDLRKDLNYKIPQSVLVQEHNELELRTTVRQQLIKQIALEIDKKTSMPSPNLNKEIQQLDSIININKGETKALELIGKALVATGQDKEALKYYKLRTEKQDFGDAETHYQMAMIYKRTDTSQFPLNYCRSLKAASFDGYKIKKSEIIKCDSIISAYNYSIRPSWEDIEKLKENLEPIDTATLFD